MDFVWILFLFRSCCRFLDALIRGSWKGLGVLFENAMFSNDFVFFRWFCVKNV